MAARKEAGPGEVGTRDRQLSAFFAKTAATRHLCFGVRGRPSGDLWFGLAKEDVTIPRWPFHPHGTVKRCQGIITSLYVDNKGGFGHQYYRLSRLDDPAAEHPIFRGTQLRTA